MKNDIVRFHSWLRPQDVVVTGAPQYDFFFEKELLQSRENFLRRHGLTPDKLLITYAGGGQRFPKDHECLQIILEAIATKKIRKPVQIWVRFYGASDFRHLLPQDLIKNIDIHFEVAPSEYWGKFRIETRWEKGDDDLKNYINMIYHSDMVICSASTVSIDAAVFNKPIVNICFDGYQTSDFFSSVRRSYFTESHYQKVVRSGAIQLAMDPEEMIVYINQALDDPSIGSDNRKRLVSEICGRVDGDSSERMARAIISAINELST